RDELSELTQNFRKQRRNRTMMVAREIRQKRKALGDGLVQESFEHGFFALEIEVDRPLGNAGALTDILHARRGESLLGENKKRRLEDFLRSRVLPPPPAHGRFGPRSRRRLRVGARRVSLE